MTEINDARDFLEAVTGYTKQAGTQRVPTQDRPNRLGKIDPAYTSGSGLPKVVFDGETTASGKAYPYLASYTPVANDRVALLPFGSGYLIIGKIIR